LMIFRYWGRCRMARTRGKSRQWPQFTLRGLMLAMVVVSMMVLGISRVRETERRGEKYRHANTLFSQRVEDFESAKKWGKTPIHRVTLTRPFYLGRTEVTQDQWQAVMGSAPSNNIGPNLPVERVSWNDCNRFLGKAGTRTGQTCRLPTEAEWELACRGGTFGFSDEDSNINDYACCLATNGWTHAVAGKKPNGWGLHDMYGNVWEWCQDWHGHSIKSSGSDPTGPSSGFSRVVRGGSWRVVWLVVSGSSWHRPETLFSTVRRGYETYIEDNEIGFRVALTIVP
jgi:formylglycine-generating enzyme required for sulfatase activity